MTTQTITAGLATGTWQPDPARGRTEPRHVVRRVQERGAEPDRGPAGVAPAQPVAALIVWSNSSSPPWIM
jgi:hypothetical protein